MCDFISWIEHDNKNYFLTKKDLESKEGKAFIKQNGFVDIEGHGAIRALYPELKKLGLEKECVDFSTPKTFPSNIVKAIKNGDFEGVGICLEILNARGVTEYNKLKQLAWAEYNKLKQLAWAEYNKLKQLALAEYNKLEQLALAEYNKIQQLALAEYNKLEQLALAEYNKIQQPALAEYYKLEQLALAEYNKIQQREFWQIARQKKYRVNQWQ